MPHAYSRSSIPLGSPTALGIVALRIAATLIWGTVALLSVPGHVSAQSGALSQRPDLRVEWEDKLLVPLEQADEVWRFLHDWLVENPAGLASLDPTLASKFSEELFTDTYFDTPDLRLLADEHGLRFRHRVNRTDPSDPKSGRSLVQLKLSGISDDALERGEFKFDVADAIDLELPILQILRRSERSGLQARLSELGVDARTVRPILTITDLRRRIYLDRHSTPILSVSHDHVTVRKLWASVEFVEIEPELNEVIYTAADSATRQEMAAIGERISSAIMERFPDVRRDLMPKYGKAAVRLDRAVPGFRSLVRFGLHDGDGAAAILVIAIGVLGAAAVAGARGIRRLRERPAGIARTAANPGAGAREGARLDAEEISA